MSRDELIELIAHLVLFIMMIWMYFLTTFGCIMIINVTNMPIYLGIPFILCAMFCMMCYWNSKYTELLDRSVKDLKRLINGR